MTKPRVLVTGSSRGIGQAIALELAKNGWQVAVHYSQDFEGASRCQELLGECASGCYQFDLSDVTQAKEIFDAVDSDGALAAVVNNAGVYIPFSFLDGDDSEFEERWARDVRHQFTSTDLHFAVGGQGILKKRGWQDS